MRGRMLIALLGLVAVPAPGMTSDGIVDPEGLAYRDGSLYVADRGAHVIHAIDVATGSIRTVAGNGTDVITDGVHALETGMTPGGMAFGPDGDLYFTDRLRLRRMDAQTGVVTTVAGGAAYTPDQGDGGLATDAYVAPFDVAVDPFGAVYVSTRAIPLDCSPHGSSFACWDARVRRIDPSTGTIESVLVHDGILGYLTVGPLGELTLSELTRNDCCTYAYIWRAPPGGRSWVRYGGLCWPCMASSDYDPQPYALWFTPGENLAGVAADDSGNVFIAHGRYSPVDRALTIRQIHAASVVRTIAGDPARGGCADGDARAALFLTLDHLEFGDGKLFTTEHLSPNVRVLDLAGGTVGTLAGPGC